MRTAFDDTLSHMLKAEIRSETFLHCKTEIVDAGSYSKLSGKIYFRTVSDTCRKIVTESGLKASIDGAAVSDRNISVAKEQMQ